MPAWTEERMNVQIANASYDYGGGGGGGDDDDDDDSGDQKLEQILKK